MRRLPALACALALILIASNRPAAAAWPHEPNNGNVPVCTNATEQIVPTICSDGAGGAIITWIDYRAVSADIYAQRINAAGVPLWTANGVAVCNAASNQFTPTIVADGAGGAIITWYDQRTAVDDIYAQRINAAGVPQWTANGVALCLAAGDQYNPMPASDGAGGAIVAWVDVRSGNLDVYAQRINAAGAPQWTANGVSLCNVAGDQNVPVIVSDGAGGAIVTWQDARVSAGNNDIYAQRINAAGTIQWFANGATLCTSSLNQLAPAIVSDGTGGAIVTWEDHRDPTQVNVFAQRLSGTGGPQWPVNGQSVSLNAADDQLTPAIISDGAGGAIVTWRDLRGGSLNDDVYAQRLSGSGEFQWSPGGVGLCTQPGIQQSPTLASDGLGGAIVTWVDRRGSGLSQDLYAQRVSASGSAQWASNGVAVCAAPRDQNAPTIVADGAGGAIITWYDFRSGNNDIYAQRVERFGELGNPEPAITGVKDVKNDQGGYVKVSWSASYLDVNPEYVVYDYRLWRSVPAAALTAHALLARGATRDPDEAALSGRYLVQSYAATDYAWEIVGMQLAAGLPSYSLTTTTTSDSIAASNPRTAFMVEARETTAPQNPHWFSAPDSGYSVDNLPPLAPAPFTGQYAAGTTQLHWNRNVEADLVGYRLYRGTTAGFVPGPGNLVGALPDTGYTDAAGAPYIYKLTAVDVHGNESPIATLIPSGTVDVGDTPAFALSFAAPNPNPAHGATTLEYTLARAGHVRLSIYDAAGRRVQVLRDGDVAAGAHRERFALRDEAGRELASGLYLVQLEAEGRVITRRFAAIR